jgi:hypothetical protein
LDTTSSKEVEKALVQFQKKIKGKKALEFAIWKHAYKKYKGNYAKLLLVQEKMRKIAVGLSKQA